MKMTSAIQMYIIRNHVWRGGGRLARGAGHWNIFLVVFRLELNLEGFLACNADRHGERCLWVGVTAPYCCCNGGLNRSGAVQNFEGPCIRSTRASRVIALNCSLSTLSRIQSRVCSSVIKRMAELFNHLTLIGRSQLCFVLIARL